jgi:hypothetical protein
MRANWNATLEERLRRPDPDARVMVEAVVVSNEDSKISKADWNGADSNRVRGVGRWHTA